MRELEFLPTWYPQLQRRRRSLSTRAWAAAAAAGGLASIAIVFRIDAWPNSQTVSILTMASIAAGALWIVMLSKLRGLTVASAAGDIAQVMPDTHHVAAKEATPRDPFTAVIDDIATIAGIANLHCERTGRNSVEMHFDANLPAVSELLHRIQQLKQQLVVSELNINGDAGETSRRCGGRPGASRQAPPPPLQLRIPRR